MWQLKNTFDNWEIVSRCLTPLNLLVLVLLSHDVRSFKICYNFATVQIILTSLVTRGSRVVSRLLYCPLLVSSGTSVPWHAWRTVWGARLGLGWPRCSDRSLSGSSALPWTLWCSSGCHLGVYLLPGLEGAVEDLTSPALRSRDPTVALWTAEEEDKKRAIENTDLSLQTMDIANFPPK